MDRPTSNPETGNEQIFFNFFSNDIVVVGPRFPEHDLVIRDHRHF